MSTPTLPSDPDNDGLTQWYAIRYPKPGESVADAQQQLEALAVTVDTALRLLRLSVDDTDAAIRQDYSAAASKAYVDAAADVLRSYVDSAVAKAGAATAVVFTRVAGVITQAVETRPDSSKRLVIFRYANDRLVSVTRYNPSAVEILTYDGAGRFTGFTTA